MTVWRHTCLIFALLPAVCWGFSMENLRDLHEAGDPDATYMYAAQHFADMAGDPNFDFYYGVAAINSGRASQGVFALERVLAVVPQNLAARVELARGYFQLEEYARARAEFETAIEVGAPPSIKQRIDRYLRAIRRHEGRYQTRLEGFAELGVGHNSNVNNAPDDIDDLELTLDNPAIDDNYTVLSGGISVNAPFAVGSAFFIGLSADQFDYSDESDFNTGNVRFNTGLKFYDDTNRFRISLLGRSYSLDGDTFRDTAGLLADWRIETSQTQRINMFARVGELSYPDQELRDASTVSLGGGLTQNATGRFSAVYFTSAFIGADEADGSSVDARRAAERNFAGLQAGVQLSITSGIRVVNRISLVTSRYDEATALTSGDRKRDDDLVLLSSKLVWLINESFSVIGTLRYSNNQSNIDALEYDGFSGDVRVRYDLN